MSDQMSVTGKLWKLRLKDDREALMMSQKLGVPEVIGRILAGRGVSETDHALSFMTPKMTDLPDPLHLKDMEKAVNRLVSAIENDEKIAVFGDYDVDGGCATALLIRYFRSIGLEALLYIPDRMLEGYGPNPEAMDKLKEMGAKVVITVDCGSVAFEPMARAKEIGLDVIITDHHQTVPELPDCVALINPNRIDETSDCTMLCGAGVAFYLVLALTRTLREKNFFADKKEPDNRFLLDLVAVSTVCDMVPLTGPNRVLVQQGLKALAMRKNFGLAALGDVAGIDERPGVYHAGFVIGPRINAGGRIGACDLGAKLLSTTNQQEATDIAEKLNVLNDERKEIEQTTQELAMRQAEQQFTPDMGALVLSGEGWHPGVIGIVASRVKEKYHRPVIIISEDDPECKGSGRSVTGVDLGRAIIDCKERGLLLKGGGHKMAAGLSMEKSKIPAFRDALNEIVLAQAAEVDGIFQPALSVDGFITPEAVNPEFMKNLDMLEPYGMSHPEPRFVFKGVTIAFAKEVGADGSHITLSFEQSGGKKLKGIAFRANQTELGPFLLNAFRTKQSVTICGVLRKNIWNGVESTQIQVQDAFKGKWSPE